MRPGLIHLHCGDVAAGAHRKSGLPGQLRVARDSPCVGPWSRDREQLECLRANWWGLPPEAWRDGTLLEDLDPAAELILWFGPDPWEQACLLWVLAELPMELLPDLVPLAEGAGRLPPGELPRRFAQRTLLDAGTLLQARALWGRFLMEGWGGLGGAAIPELPGLAPALVRLAEDHPPQGPGRTSRQVRALLGSGVRDLAGLMAALADLEDPAHGAWYGDLHVARMAEAMGVRLG